MEISISALKTAVRHADAATLDLRKALVSTKAQASGASDGSDDVLRRKQRATASGSVRTSPSFHDPLAGRAFAR